MERFVDIDEISDGRKYSIEDTAPIGCNNCSGCYECCCHMGKLITLDPYDIYRLTQQQPDGRRFSFADLMQGHIELMVDRGVIIPALKMDPDTGKCTYLNEEGRCSIHGIRPGICRLFPMGRLYEEGSFYYFLQKDECPGTDGSLVKLKTWLDTPEIRKYEKFVCDWHYFIRSIQEKTAQMDGDKLNQVNMMLLKLCYVAPYGSNFYAEVRMRMDQTLKCLG